MKRLITKILLLSSLLTLGACSAESNQKTSNTDSTVSSSVKDTSSESKEKEEQKVKEIAEKKKLEKQKAKEEAEKKQQEEKRKAEEQRQQAIAQEQARQVAQAKQQNNQQTVLVTPTGKKYHNHICGNGNYSPATLQEALNRGLTPCEKCYGGETTNPSEEITSSSTIEGEPVIDTNSSSSEINSDSTITVQSGEGPKQLAERAGITIDRLFELNGIDSNNYFLYSGQELRIK